MAESNNAQCSGFVDNWQAGKTLAECNLRMLQEEDSCDVTFRCGTERHVVKAHRYMLISRSCVFHAMFSGPMAEKPEVNIPEIESDVFKTFLRYLYTDQTDVNSENVTGLAYVSRKYGVESLENTCKEFLDENMSLENVCVILNAAHCLDMKELVEKALRLIRQEGDRPLQSPDFLTLRKDLVDQIVSSDNLVADEHLIFNAVNNWSEAECRRQGREVTPEIKRSLLGETLMEVRFPLMEQLFLINKVKQTGLLNESEYIKILEYTIQPSDNASPFKTQKRKSRFKFSPGRLRKSQSSWSFTGNVDAISFQCNTDVSCHGYQLYGNENQEYKVTTFFGENDAELSTPVQEETVFQTPSKCFTFWVNFPGPVRLLTGKWYTLAVRMTGPDTTVGEGGTALVECDDGVVFKFKRSTMATNVSAGQIPSLMYSIKSGTMT